METFHLWLDLVAFVWGAIWGSFLNVVIYRLPAGLSLVSPPSRCPKCETQLAFYDNVPIFGWLWLRGKCRYCKTPISPRYPGIELFTALLSLAVWWHVSRNRLDIFDQDSLLAVAMAFLFLFYFVAILISITFIDLDETIIPHELTGLGLVLGVLAAWLVPDAGPMTGLWPQVDVIDSLIGAAVGGGFIAFIIIGYKLVRGVEGMGWGDFTMMGMCGAWVGWQGVFFMLFAASIQGLIVTIVYAVVQKIRGEEGDFLIEDVDAIDKPPEEAAEAVEPSETPPEGEEDGEEKSFGQLAVPFGPFIALAAVEYMLLGQWLVPLMLGR